MYKIGITQIVTHPALDAAVKGFKEALAAKGFVEGKNVTYDMQNAQGDISTAATIAQKFASEGLDLIYSVATPTSQAVVKVTTTIPIVFCAVTDPVGAGLVKDLDGARGQRDRGQRHAAGGSRSFSWSSWCPTSRPSARSTTPVRPTRCS